MLNNVDTKALFGAMDAIKANPEQGIAEYGVALEWDQGVRANVKTMDMKVGDDIIPRDFSWVVDEPPQLLGNSTGPTPQEYLMSGVGACIMVGFAVNAAVKGVEIKSLEVEVTGSLDLAGFMNLRDDAQIKMIGLQYHISVDADADESQLAEIQAAAVNFSPNAMTVAQGVPLTGTMSRFERSAA